MKQKMIILFLSIGIIFYTCMLGTSSVSNIFLISIFIYMIAVLKYNDKKISGMIKKQDELVNLINNIPIAAFLKDKDNNIIAANSEFFRLIQYIPTQDYKEISKYVYSQLDICEIKKEEEQIIKNGETIETDKLFNIGKDTVKFKVYKTPIFDNFKQVTRIAVFIKKEEENIEISENNKNIIATLTHDLKTPAVAQVRAIELLLKGKFGEINETQRSFLTDIHTSCNNMLDMLVNMLWLYKFDSKRVAVNISSFDVNELIRDIFNENKLILNEKNHNFKQNNKTAKIHILADKMHIKRIIFNLLINAITHSKEKTTILIDTNVVNNSFIFKITNEGEYLSEELLDCIFDKNKVFNQKCDGLSTGLGLYLSNSLLELNGGKFLYNSSPEGFNTFGFTLELSPQKNSLNNISMPVKK